MRSTDSAEALISGDLFCKATSRSAKGSANWSLRLSCSATSTLLTPDTAWSSSQTASTEVPATKTDRLPLPRVDPAAIVLSVAAASLEFLCSAITSVFSYISTACDHHFERFANQTKYAKVSIDILTLAKVAYKKVYGVWDVRLCRESREVNIKPQIKNF